MKRIRLDLVAGLTLALASSTMAQQAGDVLQAGRVIQSGVSVSAVTPQSVDMEWDKPHHWHTIPLHYASPGWVAWCIDPEKNAEPVEIVNAREVAEGNSGKSGPARFANANFDFASIVRQRNGLLPVSTGRYALPLGVIHVVPVDGSNMVLALTTDNGMERLTKLIADVDKPAPRVSMKVQVVEIYADKSVTQFPKFDDVMPVTKHIKGGFEQGPAPADFRQRIADLEKEGRAKTLCLADFPAIASKVTVGNSQVTLLPSKDAAKDEIDAFKMARELANDKNWDSYSLAHVASVKLVPFVTDDDSVTFGMNFTSSLELIGKRPGDHIVLQTLGSSSMMTTLQEPGTQAYTSGLSQTLTPDNAFPDGSRPGPITQTVTFITVDIITRSAPKIASLPR